MPLSERLSEYVRACFAGLWIQSHEHDEALAEIAQLCRQEVWRMAVWDIDRGLQAGGEAIPAADPLSAVRALPALAAADAPILLVLVNFHRYLTSAEVVQAVAHQVALGKQQRTFLVVLSPVVQLPVELEKVFVVLEHELPGRAQLEHIARELATRDGELPEDLAPVLDASAGLTRYEAEGAFSLSLIRQGRLSPELIWELKEGTLKKSGLLQLYRGRDSFADLGGLDALKSFCRRALDRAHAVPPEVRPRGVLLLSPPGCGKSAFAKALGHETGRPTLILDIGALLGSLVGQTEQNIRQALQIAEACAPCILFVDELEKALSGARAGSTDSGVSARLFGTLLTWLNDHQSDVFFVGTCNDVSQLPPEFSRAERFDGVFFLDLPGAEQRNAIWRQYQERFGLSEKLVRPIDTDWTGAEIRSCCRLATLLGVSLLEAAQHVVPIARTAAESVERLRAWAHGRCLSADHPGVYARSVKGRGRRRALSDPSTN